MQDDLEDYIERQTALDSLFPEALKLAAEELDGSNRAAVRMLTGFTDDELTDLGGFSDDADGAE